MTKFCCKSFYSKRGSKSWAKLNKDWFFKRSPIRLSIMVFYTWNCGPFLSIIFKVSLTFALGSNSVFWHLQRLCRVQNVILKEILFFAHTHIFYIVLSWLTQFPFQKIELFEKSDSSHLIFNSLVISWNFIWKTENMTKLITVTHRVVF